jgi:hypothetical protein
VKILCFTSVKDQITMYEGRRIGIAIGMGKVIFDFFKAKLWLFNGKTKIAPQNHPLTHR